MILRVNVVLNRTADLLLLTVTDVSILLFWEPVVIDMHMIFLQNKDRQTFFVLFSAQVWHGGMFNI